MKHFVYVFLLLLGLLSCRQSSVDGTLSGIDSVLSEHPEKALAQLDSLRKIGVLSAKKDSMYAKLLRNTAKNLLYLPLDDVKDLDELASYYQQTDNKELLPRAYYLVGRCLHDMDSILQAVIYYHKALECLDENQSSNIKLRGAVNAQIGDLFFSQNYLRYAKKFYLEACRCDSLCHDHQSLAYDLRDIAVIYEYLNQKDSAIYFAKQALAIADKLSDNSLKAEISSEVATCYLEIDLDSVRKYMQPYLMGESVPSDGVSYYRSLYYMKTNDFQLAEKELWELAANKRLDVRKHAYLQLTSLFLQQGKVERADSCFQEFVECSDSLELESESEKEAKGTALYDYMYQKERGNQLEIDNKNDLLLILLLGMILLILLSLVAFYWQMSIMKKIKLQNKLKDLKIHSILSPMDSAHLNEQILTQVGISANLSQGKHLSDEQCQKLEGVFNSHYPHFKDHLYSCSKLSEQEYHVCMLVKLGLGSSKISVLTSKAISTISTTKQRLFKKITREDGCADQLAELLATM